MSLDLVNLTEALFGIATGILAIFVLVGRNQRPAIAVGMGGSLILFGLIILAIALDQLHGISIWVTSGFTLFILGSSIYSAIRKGNRK